MLPEQAHEPVDPTCHGPCLRTAHARSARRLSTTFSRPQAADGVLTGLKGAVAARRGKRGIDERSADGVLTGLKGPWLLDVGWREIDERSAEQSPRLEPLFSRLRQPNARLESTGLRPATQPRTLLGEQKHMTDHI